MFLEPVDAPAAVRAAAAGIPVHVRSSGGTAVVQLEGDIAWAVALPRAHPGVGRGFPRAYRRLGSPLVRVLEEFGLTTEWRPAPGLSDELCLLGTRGEALFAGPIVVGGAAQHLTGTALLHHGVVNVGIDRTLLAKLFGLPPPSLTRVGGIREVGFTGTPEELARRLADGLRDLQVAPPV